jgi:hypothetical protein
MVALSFPRINVRDCLGLAACLKLQVKRGTEPQRHWIGALGNRQHAAELDHAVAVTAQRGKRIFAQGPARDVRRHPRIAVAIAADPRTKLEEGRHIEITLGVKALQRTLGLDQHLRRHLEQRLVEEVQAP